MSILKFKNPDGTWSGVTAIQGEPGKDGAIQYKPGKGINITEDNVIEAEFEDITVDETPVEGSNNPVSSGGVFDAIKSVAHVVDYNITGYPTYASSTIKELPQAVCDDLTNYINSVYGKLERFNLVLLLSYVPVFFSCGVSSVQTGHNIYDFATKLSSKPTKLGFSGMFQYKTNVYLGSYTSNGALSSNGYLLGMGLGLELTWEGDVATVTKARMACLSGGSDHFIGGTYVENQYLSRYNTAKYTPTSNYHPATKKYVDDSLNNIPIPDIPMDIRHVHTSNSEGGYVYGSGINILSECKDVIDSIINEQLDNPVIYLSFDKQGVGKNKSYLMFPSQMSKYFPDTNTQAIYNFNTYIHDYNTSGSETGLFLYVVTLEITGSWNDGVFTTTRAWVTATGKYNVYTINQSKSNFLAKTNTTEFTPTADYHPATKKYVDDVVGNSSNDVKGFYHIGLDLGEINTGSDWTENFLPVACLPELGELINKIITDGVKQPIVVIENTSEVVQGRTFLFNVISVNQGETNTTSYHFQGVMDCVKSLNDGKQTTYDVAALLDVNGEMVDGKFEIYEGEDTCILQCASSSCLTLFNELEFTPTGDYNPATKKYVDDAIANAGGGSEDDGNKIAPLIYHINTKDVYLGSKNTNPETCAQLSTILTDVFSHYGGSSGEFSILWTDAHLYISALFSMEYGAFGRMFANVLIYDSGYTQSTYELNINYTSDGFNTGIFTVTDFTIKEYLTPLKIANPKKDTQAATKKYVDDAVAGASGGITAETDPIFSASEAAKITSTDTANWNSKVDINAVNNAINTTLSSKSYLTSESDPTVPSWAKQPNKPTYTASEVGALPASTVIPTVPTKLSSFTDDLGTSPKHSHSQYLTAHQDISGKQNKVLYGTADPTSDIGAEGDIYIKYV